MFTITTADTDAQRREVHSLFDATFPDIAPDGVPAVRLNEMYKPIIPMVRSESGELLGAALSCRAQVAAGWTMLSPAMAGRIGDYGPVLDRHSELDMIAVTPEARGQGIGVALVRYIEQELVARGVRAWFGSVIPGLETDRLRGFYQGMGFKALEAGADLPSLLGRRWMPPGALKAPGFFFYKKPAL